MIEHSKYIVLLYIKINRYKSGGVFFELDILELEVHLKKYGFIRLFHSLNRKGVSRYWATNFLPMNNEDRLVLQSICWTIENYHRAIKELCGVEKCQARKGIIQRNHINCSLRAYLRFEVNKFLNGVTPYDAQWQIIKVGISEYIQNPKYAL